MTIHSWPYRVFVGVPNLLVNTCSVSLVRCGMRRTRTTVSTLVLIVALGGCGGGGGDAAPPPKPAQPQPPVAGNAPPPQALPTSNGDTGGGHWWGAVSRAGQVINDAFCLLVEQGELACVLLDQTPPPIPSVPPYIRDRIVGALHGAVQVSNSIEAVGSGKTYAIPGHVLADGNSVVADLTINGGSVHDNDSKLELKYESLGNEDTFSGNFDHYYVAMKPALLWHVEGLYPNFDIYGDPASLSIDDAGALDVQSVSGCVGSGLIGNVPLPADPSIEAYNAYTVELRLDDCGDLDGDYRGLATLIDFSWVNGTDNLVIAVFNDTAALVGEAVKY